MSFIFSLDWAFPLPVFFGGDGEFQILLPYNLSCCLHVTDLVAFLELCGIDLSNTAFSGLPISQGRRRVP